MSQPAEPCGVPNKFKHLKRIQHRMSSSSAASSQEVTSRENSSYRLESDKSSFMDVFNCRRQIERSESSCEPTAKKQQEAEPDSRAYNPEKYYSEEIELAVVKLVQEQERLQHDKQSRQQSEKAPFNAKPQQDKARSTIPQKHTQISKQQDYAPAPKVSAPAVPVISITNPPAPDPAPEIAEFDLEGMQMQAYPKESQAQSLSQCQSCFRTFNQASFGKHQKVCQKVFFKKRSTFNSAKQRTAKPPPKS